MNIKCLVTLHILACTHDYRICYEHSPFAFLFLRHQPLSTTKSMEDQWLDNKIFTLLSNRGCLLYFQGKRIGLLHFIVFIFIVLCVVAMIRFV